MEEVFKPTNDQLDWHNPEGRPYPHDLSKPLPLIQNARGRQVIPFDHFINNDLEYLKGGSLSKKYTTSLTKTKAADYGHVKWIDDKVPRSIWSPMSIQDTGSLLLPISRSWSSLVTKIWKRLLFKGRTISYTGFEKATSKDFVAKKLKICYFFVFEKKINLSRPDSYRSNLKKLTPYTTYHDIQGILYQDDMDINRLMRTDELHKFSDGTLNHVCTALNDIAIGIQIEYLPKRKWSKQDNQRAWVMINAIDKKLRDRRLMRSPEKFVGGRPYGGDIRLLQRTI
ncbi:hypothetical protein Tco_1056271 [Tanacetum coccineum]|uniref:Uncharacterized protein n=1 Tax=Tanacetum coccineum TaxID=301880 RepID=A0ABQ5H381_9ASTR